MNIAEFYLHINEELVCVVEMDNFFLKFFFCLMDCPIIFSKQTLSVEKILLDSWYFSAAVFHAIGKISCLVFFILPYGPKK